MIIKELVSLNAIEIYFIHNRKSNIAEPRFASFLISIFPLISWFSLNLVPQLKTNQSEESPEKPLRHTASETKNSRNILDLRRLFKSRQKKNENFSKALTSSLSACISEKRKIITYWFSLICDLELPIPNSYPSKKRTLNLKSQINRFDLPGYFWSHATLPRPRTAWSPKLELQICNEPSRRSKFSLGRSTLKKKEDNCHSPPRQHR